MRTEMKKVADFAHILSKKSEPPKTAASMVGLCLKVNSHMSLISLRRYKLLTLNLTKCVCDVVTLFPKVLKEKRI